MQSSNPQSFALWPLLNIDWLWCMQEKKPKQNRSKEGSSIKYTKNTFFLSMANMISLLLSQALTSHPWNFFLSIHLYAAKQPNPSHPSYYKKPWKLFLLLFLLPLPHIFMKLPFILFIFSLYNEISSPFYVPFCLSSCYVL